MGEGEERESSRLEEERVKGGGEGVERMLWNGVAAW